MPKASCLKADGTPKRGYATIAEAQAEAAKHHGAYTVYVCAEHGYHVGGGLSRALRSSLNAAKHRKRA